MGLRLLALLCLATAAFAGETAWDLRLRFSPSHPDSLSPGVRYQNELTPNLPYTFAAQMAFSPTQIRHLVYQAGIAYFPLWPVLKIETTLFHAVMPTFGAGWTGLTAKAAFDTPVVGNFDVYGAFGWYERFSQASGISVLPIPGSQSEREHDFLFRFGLRYHFSDFWRAQFETASFDEYEVYNLNGPFFQAAVDHVPAPGDVWRAYARYQMLLGFGRLDELVVGAEVRFSR